MFDFLQEYLGGKRTGTITNDEAGMLTAITWSLKSKDPSTQVGSCIISKDGRVLTTGYNGTPNAWNDDSFPWGRDTKTIGEENTKYPYVIHSEVNSIMNYKGLKSDFDGATMYVTLFPCSNCAKVISQSGIKRVVYLADYYKNLKDTKCAKTLLEACGIEYIEYKELMQVSNINIELNTEEKEYVKMKYYDKTREE